MDAESQGPKSLDLAFLVLHEPVQPFKPAGKDYMACNLCKRPVDKNPPHDEPMITSIEDLEAQARYIGLETNLKILFSQLQRNGIDVDRRVEALERMEQVLEFLLRMLLTNRERLDLESVILEGANDKFTKFINELKQQRIQDQLDPLGAAKKGLLGPDGRPTRK